MILLETVFQKHCRYKVLKASMDIQFDENPRNISMNFILSHFNSN